MPTESQSSAPAVAAMPRMFCKGCGYALVGLSSHVCPECGRAFDPANRRTFATRPPRGWVWRCGKWLAAVVLLIMLIAGAGLGWLWWGWHGEQPTIARLRALNQQFTFAPIGPERLRSVLGKRLSYLADRVASVEVHDLKSAETGQLDFRSLSQIQKFWLVDCELSNGDLNHLLGLEELRELALDYPTIEKPDLAFLEKLPALSKLYLSGQWLPSTGFEHIGRLSHLKVLGLDSTGTTDADLEPLRGLSSLEKLHLEGNPITDAGLEHLQVLRSLKHLGIDMQLVRSPGMVKLKQAIPRLLVLGD